MKHTYLIQTYSMPIVPPQPKNFLSGMIKSNKVNVTWSALFQEEFKTFEEAAGKCEKLIRDGSFKASRLRIVEVVGTFESETTVSVNKVKEVVVVTTNESLSDANTTK